MTNSATKITIEIDITHRCNMRCRHCNRLCNAEDLYCVTREHKDMERKHIDFLYSQILSYPKGRIGLLRIIGGEPLLSKIIDYAIIRFEDLVRKGFADDINIVTNGTVKPSDLCKKYLVYSPVCIGEMIKEKGRELTKEEVYSIKNYKHRNITVSPKDIHCQATICNRIDVCGIQYSVYGFSYTAACFPAMFVSKNNHSRFLHYLPVDIKDFFDSNFENEVCSICVSAIENYKTLVSKNPEIQDIKYVGQHWRTVIDNNSKKFNEADTSWINNVHIDIKSLNFRDLSQNCDIRPHKIYRSANLSALPYTSFKSIIEEYGITHIIDLRTDNEYKWANYKASYHKICKIVRLPIDPSRRSENFELNYSITDRNFVQYAYCATDCKKEIQTIFNEIDPTKDQFLIHCHSGKDRTGCIAAIFQLLAGVSKDEIIKDYLTSGSDTTSEKIEYFLSIVLKDGSIENYLKSCEITETTINKWKKSIIYGTK